MRRTRPVASPRAAGALHRAAPAREPTAPPETLATGSRPARPRRSPSGSARGRDHRSPPPGRAHPPAFRRRSGTCRGRAPVPFEPPDEAFGGAVRRASPCDPRRAERPGGARERSARPVAVVRQRAVRPNRRKAWPGLVAAIEDRPAADPVPRRHRTGWSCSRIRAAAAGDRTRRRARRVLEARKPGPGGCSPPRADPLGDAPCEGRAGGGSDGAPRRCAGRLPLRREKASEAALGPRGTSCPRRAGARIERRDGATRTPPCRTAPRSARSTDGLRCPRPQPARSAPAVGRGTVGSDRPSASPRRPAALCARSAERAVPRRRRTGWS